MFGESKSGEQGFNPELESKEPRSQEIAEACREILSNEDCNELARLGPVKALFQAVVRSDAWSAKESNEDKNKDFDSIDYLKEKGIFEDDNRSRVEIKQTLRVEELKRRKLEKEIDENNYDLNDLYYLNGMNLSVTRKNVGTRALVVTADEMEMLGSLGYISANGKEYLIDSDQFNPGDVFMLLPEELGELES